MGESNDRHFYKIPLLIIIMFYILKYEFLEEIIVEMLNPSSADELSRLVF